MTQPAITEDHRRLLALQRESDDRLITRGRIPEPPSAKPQQNPHALLPAPTAAPGARRFCR